MQIWKDLLLLHAFVWLSCCSIHPFAENLLFPTHATGALIAKCLDTKERTGL